MTVFFHASQSCFPPIALHCGLSNWDVKKRGCFSRMCSRVASTPQSAPGLENQGLVAMICHFGVMPRQPVCSLSSAFHHQFGAVCSAFTLAVADVFWI